MIFTPFAFMAPSGPPPAFSPADITGIQEWWNSSAGILLDGSNVDQWTGQINSTILATNTIGNGLLYNASDSNVNNKPSLANDGSTYASLRNTTVLSDFTPTQNRSQFYIFRANTGNSGYSMLGGQTTTAGNASEISAYISAPSNNDKLGSYFFNGGSKPSTLSTLNKTYCFIVTYNSAGTAEYYIIDEDGTTSTFSVTGLNANDINPFTLEIGGYNNGLLFNGLITEFGFVNGIMSTSDIADLQQYMLDTYTTLDPDAQAFFTATGITDATIQSAIDTLVKTMKADGIWSKMYALYPFVGGTASTNSYNLINPAAYTLSYTGTVTHNSDGITGNGTNGYADTGLNIVSDVVNYKTDHHISLYSRTATQSGGSAGWDMGVGIPFISPYPIYGMAIGRTAASQRIYDFANYLNNGRMTLSSTTSDNAGFFLNRTSASNEHKMFKNGSQIASSTLTTTANDANGSIWILRLNPLGSGTTGFSNRNIALSSIGQALNDTEQSDFYNAVQAFQTTLGRQV